MCLYVAAKWVGLDINRDLKGFFFLRMYLMFNVCTCATLVSPLLINYLVIALQVSSLSSDIYDEWCPPCASSMLMKPGEHHLSDALSKSLSFTVSHTTHTCLTCWEHRVLLYQASAAGAIRKIQTEHKLSPHTVPIREGETGSEERPKEETYKHSLSLSVSLSHKYRKTHTFLHFYLCQDTH